MHFARAAGGRDCVKSVSCSKMEVLVGKKPRGAAPRSPGPDAPAPTRSFIPPHATIPMLGSPNQTGVTPTNTRAAPQARVFIGLKVAPEIADELARACKKHRATVGSPGRAGRYPPDAGAAVGRGFDPAGHRKASPGGQQVWRILVDVRACRLWPAAETATSAVGGVRGRRGNRRIARGPPRGLRSARRAAVPAACDNCPNPGKRICDRAQASNRSATLAPGSASRPSSFFNRRRRAEAAIGSLPPCGWARLPILDQTARVEHPVAGGRPTASISALQSDPGRARHLAAAPLNTHLMAIEIWPDD